METLGVDWMSNGLLLVATVTLFLTWNGLLVGVILWLNKKFADLHDAIDTRLSVDDYRRERNIGLTRIGRLEWWALRLGGSVKVDFASMSSRDNRTHNENGNGDSA